MTAEIYSWACQFCLDRNPYATPLEACLTKQNPELGHSNITIIRQLEDDHPLHEFYNAAFRGLVFS